MIEKPLPSKARLLPLLVLLVALAIWSTLWLLKVFPQSVFPSPLAVAKGLGEEFRSGRLLDDLVASLFRVTTGFALAVLLGVPVGLWLGHHVRDRKSTRLNSSHGYISYAVFCLKKKIFATRVRRTINRTVVPRHIRATQGPRDSAFIGLLRRTPHLVYRRFLSFVQILARCPHLR